MTDTKKQSEITDRLKRLSEIREELTVAKSKRSKDLRKIALAGRFFSRHLPQESRGVRDPGEPVSWPSSDEVNVLQKEIDEFKHEADEILSELKALGIDSELFKINGN